MIGVVLVSHGRGAPAMLEAVERVVGPLPAVTTVSIDPTESGDQVAAHIESAAHTLDLEQGVVFLVDLGGSTPFHACCHACSGNSAIVSGMNLPMLFKLATADRSGTPASLATELAATGQKSILVTRRGAPWP